MKYIIGIILWLSLGFSSTYFVSKVEDRPISLLQVIVFTSTGPAMLIALIFVCGEKLTTPCIFNCGSSK